jgi:protein subunit release factor B
MQSENSSLFMNPTVPSGEEEEIRDYMKSIGVREDEVEESFVRSGGHGGQNVNKTSTCVMLLHRPTGVRVKCQATRYQGRNRLLGRRLLFEKVEALRNKKALALAAQAEAARRQKRSRPRKVKARILADKSHQSAKKAQRRKGAGED